MAASDRPSRAWAVLRRRPARIVAGTAGGGDPGEFEIICYDRGDSPRLDYHAVPARLQIIRGPTRSCPASPPTTSTLNLHEEPVPSFQAAARSEQTPVATYAVDPTSHGLWWHRPMG